MDRPGEAYNTIKGIRAVYEFAIENDYVTTSPAKGIKRLRMKKAQICAAPWSAEDLRKYRETHPVGMPAYLYICLLMFTGTRISDSVLLGPKHEKRVDGQTWLEWQPTKAGSAAVTIPMAPPLEAAIRATPLTGTETYMVTDYGKPFASPEGMRNRFAKWCKAAGLENRSSHGVRKALGELLRELGGETAQIMAVLAHTEARTTEIYLKDANRRVLAASAMDALKRFKW